MVGFQGGDSHTPEVTYLNKTFPFIEIKSNMDLFFGKNLTQGKIN